MFNYIRTDAEITPDPCDGDHGCIESASDGKSYWANIFVDETLPVVSEDFRPTSIRSPNFSFPSRQMRGNMLWESKDATDQNLICFQVPVVITV